MARSRPSFFRRWFRRIRRLAIIGGIGAAIAAYRNRQLDKNQRLNETTTDAPADLR